MVYKNSEIALLGLGIASPLFSGTQHHAHEFLSQVVENAMSANERIAYLPFLEQIFKTSGIQTRYSVVEDFTHLNPDKFDFFPKNWALDPFPSTAERMAVYEETSVQLAKQAAINAMQEADIQPSDVTHLVFTTCTGFFAPGPDIALMKELGLNQSIQRTQIGFMGCCAGFNGLQVVQNIIGNQPDAVVLQICLELCSIHLQKKPVRDLWIANCIFSDGCSAAVFAQEGKANKHLVKLIATHSQIAPESTEQMSWRIGDYGFEMRLKPSVPRKLREIAKPFTNAMLNKVNHDFDAIKGWALHPGGRKIIEELELALDLNQEDLSSSYSILYNYGNMSSATLFYVLQEEIRHNNNSGLFLALGFGPGLAVEGALFERV